MFAKYRPARQGHKVALTKAPLRQCPSQCSRRAQRTYIMPCAQGQDHFQAGTASDDTTQNALKIHGYARAHHDLHPLPPSRVPVDALLWQSRATLSYFGPTKGGCGMPARHALLQPARGTRLPCCATTVLLCAGGPPLGTLQARSRRDQHPSNHSPAKDCMRQHILQHPSPACLDAAPSRS
jgi:hypothetical protein